MGALGRAGAESPSVPTPRSRARGLAGTLALAMAGPGCTIELGTGGCDTAEVASGARFSSSSAWAEVAVGGLFSCATGADGATSCWGADPPAVLGAGLAAGYAHACAAAPADDPGGAPACAGRDDAGQAQPPGVALTDLALGGAHSCGIDALGAILCWGRDQEGQASPPTLTGAVALAAGWRHSCAASPAGLACWGALPAAEAVGGGDPRALDALTAGDPLTARDAVALAAGLSHTCALGAAGALTCWGAAGPAVEDTPTEGVFVALAAGADFSCGVTQGGAIRCWGEAGAGQLQAPSGRGWVAVDADAGGRHACAVREDGGLACWGADEWGQGRPL